METLEAVADIEIHLWPIADTAPAPSQSRVGLGRYDEASQLFDEAAELCRKAGELDGISYGDVELERGRHLIRTRRLKTAQETLTRALEIYMAAQQPAIPQALKARERLADVCRANGDLERAEYYQAQQRSLIADRYSTASAPYIELMLAEAKQHLMRREFDESIKRYEETLAAAERALGKQSAVYGFAVEGLVEAHFWNKDVASAVLRLDELIAHRGSTRDALFGIYSERMQIEQSLADRGELNLLLYYAAQGQAPADVAYRRVLAVKGAVAARQRSIRLAARVPELRPLLEQLRRASAEFAEARMSGDKAAVAAKAAECERLQAELAKRSEPFRQAAEPPEVAALKQLLPASVALVDYVEYRSVGSMLEHLLGGEGQRRLLAFIVRRDGETKLVDLGPAEVINGAAATWLAAMNQELTLAAEHAPGDVAELVDGHGARVRELVWDPIAAAVEGCTTVLVSPDGVVNVCPFAALPSPRGGGYLIEKHAFASVLAPRLLAESSQRPPRPAKESSLVLVGDVDYGAAPKDSAPALFSKLPSGGAELSAVKAAFASYAQAGRVTELAVAAATEEAVVPALRDAQFIHLHTRGFCVPISWLVRAFAEQPSDQSASGAASGPVVAGIALAGANAGLASRGAGDDGILWADELSTLDLQAAELVVLAACETALGELTPAEGMMGSQRAIHVAGAHATLTALWSVNDLTTTLLMKEFYEHLWGKGLSKPVALQQAMIKLVSPPADDAQGPKANRLPPALWAGFVLHGDWQ